MKILTILLVAVVCIYASYTVENKSITVGLTSGPEMEKQALENTLTRLGFQVFESHSGEGHAFASHDCQVVFDYFGSDSVKHWKNQMIMDGRGYIQNSPKGWQFFQYKAFAINPTSPVEVMNVQMDFPLTSFPNSIDPIWKLAHGLGVYEQDMKHYLVFGTEDNLDYVATAASPEVVCQIGETVCANSLTSKNMGVGVGVFCGWNIYGELATPNDVKLLENIIIYAAQPPRADAGGPYFFNAVSAGGGSETVNSIASTNEPVIFNASNSRDNTYITKYEWDFNADGQWDFTSEKPIAKYIYPMPEIPTAKPYSGPVILRCTDSIGGQSISKSTVNVGTSPTPSKENVSTSTLGEIKAGFEK